MQVTDEMIRAALSAFDDGIGDPNDYKRRMGKALTAALAIETALASSPVQELPRASKEQSAIGWTLPVELLHELEKEAEGWADEMSIEGIEAIALSVERRILRR